MQGRGLLGRRGGGGEDKATSVSDTNMAQSQHQYYVCAPSFSASHRAIDPPPPRLAPFPFPGPSLSFACTLPLSQSCYSGRKVVVWLDGAAFSSDSTLSGAAGREVLSGFENGHKRKRERRGDMQV